MVASPSLLGGRSDVYRLTLFFSYQVAECMNACTNFFSTAPSLAVCRQACTEFPGQLCEVSCDKGLPPGAAANSNCKLACKKICYLGEDLVTYQTGVSVASRRPYCAASSVPVCLHAPGSVSVFGKSTLV